MKIAYQYRLRPTSRQVTWMDGWLELLCRQYNYRLAERFNWWGQNRCDIHACSLVVCHLPKLKDQPTYYSQKRDLVNTKALFPVRASGTESLGLVIKTATVTRKVDGWYVTLSLQDSSVPELNPDPPTWENTIGIDLGLNAFWVADEGESVEVPQYYRRTEKKLKRLQRSVSRKKKGSSRYKKAVKRLAKAHQ